MAPPPIYSRPLLRDLADTLAAVRATCWCEPQRHILDALIREFVDQAVEHDRRFDVEAFTDRARFWRDRLPTAGEAPIITITTITKE